MTITAQELPSALAAPHGVAPAIYLPQIDLLRAFAALAVVFFHLYTSVFLKAELQPLLIPADLRSHGGLWRWLASPSLLGYAGVPLFFVISGFCIHHSFLHSSKRFSYWPFMARRFWRIYPAYLFAVALALLLPGNLIWRSHHVPKSVLMHLLFVHNFNKTTIYELSPPFWTLAIEFQFYAAYPIFLKLRKWLGVYGATLISFALCAIASVAVGDRRSGQLSFLLMPVMYWVQWCLGAVIAERFSQGKPPLIPWLAAVPLWIAGILYAVPIAAHAEWNYLAWAVLGAAIMERLIRRKSWIKTPSAPMAWPIAAVIWLGTISYSIYLLHDIILIQLLPRLPGTPEMRFGLGIATAIPLIIAASTVSYYFVESPGIAAGKRVIAWFFAGTTKV